MYIANPTTNKSMTKHHLFRIASVSKPFTAVAIFKLIESGPAYNLFLTGKLLFYNSANGTCATAQLDANGNYTFVDSVSGLATGWTHVTGTPIFYNASTGDGANDRLDRIL
ncbi:serine hydrolase [Bacillus thuringiensis]|uniref:serine hydrolase n=1 Tax=Bacillus thuringiensis TaxID=1428 RepID=UPI003BF5FE52